jgi:hypothetical protein
LYYHRDTEGTEFKTETDGWFRISVIWISPKLRALCVFVVINFPSVLSCPLSALSSPSVPYSLRPGLGGAFQGSSAIGRFLDQDAQVVILRGFGQAVKGFAGFQVVSHRFKTGRDGDFIVG